MGSGWTKKSDNVAFVTKAVFNRLPEYSSSIPTGTTIGKQWKRREGNNWYLGEYIPHEDPKLVGISWKRIILS